MELRLGSRTIDLECEFEAHDGPTTITSKFLNLNYLRLGAPYELQRYETYCMSLLSAGEFGKRHRFLIVVARFNFSCSLNCNFRGLNSEEQNIGGNSNEDRNAYDCSHIGVKCIRLRPNCHVLWSRHAARRSAGRRTLISRFIKVPALRFNFVLSRRLV